jgi:hypothetical protein
LRCRYSLCFDRITPSVGYSRLVRRWPPRDVLIAPKPALYQRSIVARSHDRASSSVTSSRPPGSVIGSSKGRGTSSSQPLPRHLQKFCQPSRIGAESIRCRAKLLDAVRSIFAGALQLGVSHGNYVVDPPRPALELNADRADLDLIAAIANDNAIVVARLRVVLFAQKQVHGPMIPPIRGKMKPQGLGRA